MCIMHGNVSNIQIQSKFGPLIIDGGFISNASHHMKITRPTLVGSSYSHGFSNDCFLYIYIVLVVIIFANFS